MPDLLDGPEGLDAPALLDGGSAPVPPERPTYTWQVLVRDSDRQFVGAIEPSEFEFRVRDRAIGTWLLSVPWDGSAERAGTAAGGAALDSSAPLDAGDPLDEAQGLDLSPTTIEPVSVLATPGSGVAFFCNGTIVCSGPTTKLVRTIGKDGSRILEVAGNDDLDFLAIRVAEPEPATAAPPYDTDAYDVRTGLAETVIREYVDANAGPSAKTARVVPGLTLASDGSRGSTITEQARWEPLLEVVQRCATAGGVGFRCVQADDDLVFSVYEAEDKSAKVRFAVELGNVESITYDLSRPAGNYVYGLGGGEETARVVVEDSDSTSAVQWGRIERTRDARDTEDVTLLGQRIDEELAETAARYSIDARVLDTRQHQWAPIATETTVESYDCGDEVTVIVDGIAIADVIREVQVSHDPSGTRVVPIIGTPNSGSPTEDVVAFFTRRIRSLEAQITDLQRR